MASDSSDWFRLAVGEGCPFDPPLPEKTAAWDAVARMDVSLVCLLRDQTYRGHCMLVYEPRHAARPDELNIEEWSRYSRDLHHLVTAVASVCLPDHINVELLGNVVPHLHWHVIPRYKTDPKWGSVIWLPPGEIRQPVELASEERADLISRLRAELEGAAPNHRQQ